MFQKILQYLKGNFTLTESEKTGLLKFFNSMENTTPKLKNKMEQIGNKYNFETIEKLKTPSPYEQTNTLFFWRESFEFPMSIALDEEDIDNEFMLFINENDIYSPFNELETREMSKICFDIYHSWVGFNFQKAKLYKNGIPIVSWYEDPKDIGEQFDSISICLSKGLGAPVGSLLLGDVSFIKRARKVRKALGGGMRQAGYLAAAGLYALKNNIPLLKIDNDRSKEIGRLLESQAYVESVRPVQSNIVIFDLKEPITANQYLSAIKEKGLLASAFGPKTIRFVTHLDISKEQFEEMKSIISRDFSF